MVYVTLLRAFRYLFIVTEHLVVTACLWSRSRLLIALSIEDENHGLFLCLTMIFLQGACLFKIHLYSSYQIFHALYDKHFKICLSILYL